MSRETAEVKSHRYLTEGRVKIRAVASVGVEADVQGSADEPYKVRREGRKWSCNCPAWQRECCHVRAVRLVT